MKNKIYPMLTVMIAFILLATLLLPVQTAYASTNGQQIQVNGIMRGGAVVTIKGTNQNGKIVTWTGKTQGTPNSIPPSWGFSVSANNYWWKGLVFIQVSVDGKMVYACQTDVPAGWQVGDWKNAYMGPFRKSINTTCG